MRVFGFLIAGYPQLFGDIHYSCGKNTAGIDVEIVYLPESISPEYHAMFKNHLWQAVKFTTNRAVTHEIVRHRPVTFLQESQRYCRYSDNKFGNEVTFIEPSAFFTEASDPIAYTAWSDACRYAEIQYFFLLKERNLSPQAARTVLPNSCKTELIVYCSLKQWEHIFAMRAINKGAEPSMRQIMMPLHEEFKLMYPGFFEEPVVSVG